jgi:long-chain acyl-CoA synthetase
LPDSTRDEVVAAVIVRKPQAELTPDEVRSHCAAHLAAHKVPERIEFCEMLPRTSVGKVRKNVVREQLLDQKSDGDAAS